MYRTFVLMAALTTAAASSLAAAPENQFAYVVNSLSNNVSGYKVNSATGALTPVSGSPFHAGDQPTSLAVDQVGRFVYVTNLRDDNVAGFRIEPVTGRLIPIPGSPFKTGAEPISIATDPFGRFAYVADEGTSDISAFRIEPLTGRLIPVPGSPFPSGSGITITVDPLGKFVYQANFASSDDISAFTIDPNTGALTPVPGSPFATGQFPAPRSIAVDPLDRFVYVTNDIRVFGFDLDPNSGALTAIPGAQLLGAGISAVAVHPSGRFVYAAAGSVLGFSINSFSGALTPLAGSPFGPGESSIAVDYTGTFAYATSGPFGSGSVNAYKIDSSTGALTPIPGLPFSAGEGSVSIALVRPPTTPIYSATQIPDQIFAPLINITPSAINNEGEVTGTAIVNGGNETLAFGFLYANGTTTALVGPAHTTFAYSINDNAQVVGQAATTPPVGPFLVLSQAFLFSNGSMVNLDGRQGGQSAAFSINNSGEITGSRSTGTCTIMFGGCLSTSGLGDTHAFLDTGSGLTDIGTLGGNFSEGRGINNREEITGGSNLIANGPNHLFLYSQGAFHDLGMLDGQPTEGTAINDDSQIIGSIPAGFLYRDGAFHILPFLPGGTSTSPAGINNHGDIVGAANVPGPNNSAAHAFLYSNGELTDLNNLVDPSLTLLTSAAGINDKGEIVASGLNGQIYVLTPKH